MGSHIKSPFIAISINDNMGVMFYGKFIAKPFKAICKVKKKKNIFSFKRGFWPRSAFLIFKALTNADTLSIENFNSFEENYLMVKYDFMINFPNAYSQNNVTVSVTIVIVFATE